ncbi:hypothetical protein ACIOEX_21355 [Streptomyces sp. NPDC087850]
MSEHDQDDGQERVMVALMVTGLTVITCSVAVAAVIIGLTVWVRAALHT